MAHSRFARYASRGFTLIELMAVVVIVGLLAVAGVTLFRQNLQASKGNIAAAHIQAIRGAQEAYMAENHIYMNASTSDEGKNWYPQRVPGPKRSAWVNSDHTDYVRWSQLAPAISGSVLFSFLTNAGGAGTAIPKLQIANAPTFAAVQPLDWYVIQASGDLNGNGKFSYYASTSITGELYVENEGE